jgi:uncharacterized membrane protein YidH (DUF202 family)
MRTMIVIAVILVLLTVAAVVLGWLNYQNFIAPQQSAHYLPVVAGWI